MPEKGKDTMPEKKWAGLLEVDETFLERVYAEVARIPIGRVATYGKIAELAGYPKASREVGIAMSRVPKKSKLPCHRVVNKTGTLAPSYAFGSKENQRNLLLAEGIAFLEDGSIHMERYMWPDNPQGEQLSLFR